MSPILPNFKLPVWMKIGDVAKLAQASWNWFSLLGTWGMLPLKQLDPMTCNEKILDLIAWQRDIERFDNEPLDIYRLRVQGNRM